MASNPPGACCFTGFRHEGTPEGEIKSIGNVPAYFSYPKSNKTPDKAVIIITDVFGLYNNSKLLADDFASNGYLTVVPDLFDGDQLALDALETGKVNIQEWLAKHGTDKVDPIIEATIKHLREDLGIKKIGAAGYCFGGKYVVRFLKEGKLDAGFTAHPSFISKEELAAIQKPFSIAAAETDSIFTRELRHESEDILIKARQPYQINLFSGVVHGFAVRADLSKPENKFAKEQAFLQAVSWFNFHLAIETNGYARMPVEAKRTRQVSVAERDGVDAPIYTAREVYAYSLAMIHDRPTGTRQAPHFCGKGNGSPG